MIKIADLQWKRFGQQTVILLALSGVSWVIRAASGQFDTQINNILFFVFFFLLSFTVEGLYQWNRYLNKVLPMKDGIARRLVVQLVGGAIYALILRFVTYEFGEPHLPIKLDRMFIAATWFLYVMASVLVNAVFLLRYFISQWKASLVMAERLEKEKTQVQFDNLRNQLNPHFLFNALTSLNSLIFENQTLASQFLQHLSKVYRYVLQNKDRNFVTLQTELDFIQNYVFLLRTRFADSLTVEFEVSEESKDKAIVPVTLQILIENALKHNVVDKSQRLVISITTKEDYLTVSNNLQLRKLVESSNRQGLDNLRSLYSFLTNRPVLVESDEKSFAVSVPLV